MLKSKFFIGASKLKVKRKGKILSAKKSLSTKSYQPTELIFVATVTTGSSGIFFLVAECFQKILSAKKW